MVCTRTLVLCPLKSPASPADNPLVRRDAFVPALVVAGVCAALPPALIHFVSRDKVMLSGEAHFWSVVLSALVATAAGVALSVAGARRRDARAVLVGTAFTVMASLLVVHGVASPGFLVEMNGVVALTGAGTLPVGGVILALSALPMTRGARAVRPLLLLQAISMVGVLALGLTAIWLPGLVPAVPDPASAPALVLLAVGLLFYGLLALRALRTVMLTRRTADLAVLVGLVWLAGALIPALTQGYTDLAWWLGHGLEVAGVLLVGAPVAGDLFRASPSRPLSGDLRGAELVAAEEAYLGAQVGSLTRLLAQKDAYTEGHTRRVALLAVEVGEELGIPPARLRELAIGGLLHDIGKLSLPDEVLKKPGSLDEAEFEIVKRHPGRGDALLRELGFGRGVRRLVRSHHERLDGAGYPDGAEAVSLSLETRVLTVCDVYDALCSHRVYRAPWTHEQAIGLLRDETDVAFDRRCVAALERVLLRSGVAPALAEAV
jgi:HD-GYP domain-containing protein (c-di-GMP phosphodiesterase class II)